MADDKTVKVALILSAYDKMSRVVNDSVNKSITSVGRFNRSLQKYKQSSSGLSLGTTAGIVGAVAAIKPIIDMTEKAEEAMTDLKVSFMKAGGAIDPMYEKLMKMGAEMAKTFKGGRSEMLGMFNALINTGMNAQNITREFAVSVVQYATLMKMPYAEAATEIGRITKMANIAKKDMALLPDLLSRMRILGISNAEEIATAVGKSGLGVMGMGGLKNMQAMAAIIANIKQATGGAIEAGGAMQRIMVKMADPKSLMKLNAQMAQLGVHMQFYDKGGKFLGLQNMIVQLSQVPQELRQKVFGQMFGVRGAVAAAALAKIGVKGYNDTVKKLMNQDTLANKASEYQKHAGYKMQLAWDRMKGQLIKFGLEIMPIFEHFLTIANKLITVIEKLFSKLGILGSIIKWVIVAVTGLRIACALYNFVAGVVIKNVLFLTEGYVKMVKWVKSAADTIYYHILNMKKYTLAVWGAIKAGAKWIAQLAVSMWDAMKRAAISVAAYASTLWATYSPAIIAAISATWAFTAALLANPITWVIAGVIALAASVYLILKNWKVISAFFTRLWQSVKQIFSDAWQWIKNMFLNYTPYGLIFKHWSKIVAWFSGIWKKVKSIFSGAWEGIKIMLLNYTPIGLIIKHWVSITSFFSDLWSNVKKIFMNVVNWIMGIGSKFYEAGKNIVKMIWNGIKAMAMKPVEAISNIVKNIRKFLPFSPAQMGPLKDIHKVRIIETIAQTMKPAPMMKAMNAAMNMAIGVKPSGSGIGINSGGRSGMTLHYAPVITLSGGSLNAKDDLMKVLKSHQGDLMRLIKQATAREERIKY